MSHFEFVPGDTIEHAGHTLHRIRATKSFGTVITGTVRAGTVGGYIEHEYQLCGCAWVADDAKLYGSAVMCDDSRLFNDAELFENARMFGKSCLYDHAKAYGKSWLSGNAKLMICSQASGDAQISGDARMYGRAHISGSATLSGEAMLAEGAEVSGNRTCVSGNATVRGVIHRTPLVLTGLRWVVTIEDTHMSIGCQYHSLADWATFDDEKIRSMSAGALSFWSRHKEAILALAKSDGRV